MNGWDKTGFYALAEGFWATRVANGVTTEEAAEKRVTQQKALIDQWYPAAAAVSGEAEKPNG